MTQTPITIRAMIPSHEDGTFGVQPHLDTLFLRQFADGVCLSRRDHVPIPIESEDGFPLLGLGIFPNGREISLFIRATGRLYEHVEIWKKRYCKYSKKEG